MPLLGSSNSRLGLLPGLPPAPHGVHPGPAPPDQASLVHVPRQGRPTMPVFSNRRLRWHQQHHHPLTSPASFKLCRPPHCLNNTPRVNGSWTLDLHSKTEVMRSNSSGDLYPFQSHRPSSAMALTASSSPTIWHRHLGHPGHHCLDQILTQFSVSSSHNKSSHVCDACQKGRHVRLPFSTSTAISYFPFQLLHCDLWTSPILSFTGYNYYLVIVDDFTHYMWTFPLRNKSEVTTTFQNFYALILTQFHIRIQSLQCDNGREFDNSTLRHFLTTNGTTYRFSCPYTSSQNGKAERALRTINYVLRTLLFQADLPPKYWVEALHAATYLINRRPCKPLQFDTPYHALFGQQPDYSHLRVFGCLCYPNIASTAAHKLAPKSTPCLFLGYPPEHKGYKCMDLKTHKIILSRHVIFDENVFPFRTTQQPVPAPIAAPASTFLPGPPLPPSQPEISAASTSSTRELIPQLSTASAAPTHFIPGSPDHAATPQSLPSIPVDTISPATQSPKPSASSPSEAGALPSVFRYASPTVTRHHMLTRAKHGIFKPKQITNLSTSTTISPIPTSYRAALKDPNWHHAMLEEYNALMSNNTWCLVPKPAGVNVVTGKWIFRHKLHPDGSLARYKARWVVRGFTQEQGVDYDETFSPVIKPATIRVVLSIATSSSWPIHQLDVAAPFQAHDQAHGQGQNDLVVDQAPNLNLNMNQEIEVVIPQMNGPAINFLVDEILPDQLIDPENDIDLVPQEDINVNSMVFAHELRFDPGLEAFLNKKRLPELDLNLQLSHPVPPCHEAERLWRQFLAPSSNAVVDKVDKGLLEDVHLQKKNKEAAPVGRKQNKKKIVQGNSDDAAPEENARDKGKPLQVRQKKNAFLHGNLAETVYCVQPSGFTDPTHPNHVCKLNKSLYGLKQAPRTWFLRFNNFLQSLGFKPSRADTSLFILHKSGHTAYLLLYVDDIILTASSSTLLQQIIANLCGEFSMTDLGHLQHFLGIHVTKTAQGLFLSQSQYALEILQRAGMEHCNPVSTPVDTKSKISATDGSPLKNGTDYRSIAGALQYLTLTRPDLTYAVQQACLFMHAPRESHLQLLKRILRYVKGTMHQGLHLTRSSSSDLVTYSDADWAGCPDTRRSTSGFCVFFGDNPVSWSSKRQATVSRSSAEAEYRGVANAVAESCWIRQLLLELHRPPPRATIVFCDNISAVYMSTNPIQHQRTKHIEIDLHFVRDKVALGEIKVLHVPSSLQFADIFTKGLPYMLFSEFKNSLHVWDRPG
ncbi:hypothetical protein U9M48_037560 [Paspalum notatum var. saurae]|uniref:Integrase catalytic domain-containing protein n=1 Tax=Paspalum notatum var. saurae TaxID=547442 RepID=A0AAQ3UFU7_PASNO